MRMYTVSEDWMRRMKQHFKEQAIVNGETRLTLTAARFEVEACQRECRQMKEHLERLLDDAVVVKCRHGYYVTVMEDDGPVDYLPQEWPASDPDEEGYREWYDPDDPDYVA